MFGTWGQTIRLGLKSLLLQKMRSSLAALGIFIGTTTVIWLVAMGEGVSYQAQQQILELGATNVIVRSVEPKLITSGDNNRIKRYGLLRSDYERFLTNIPTIVRSVPIRELRREFAAGGRILSATLIGCVEDYRELNRLEVARGRWLQPVDHRQNVIVLADGLASRLFPGENAVGKKVRIESDIYTVIGQMKPRGASAAIGGSLEARDFAFDGYIPLTTFRDRVGDQIMVRTGEGFNFKGEIIELTQITLTIDRVESVDESVSIIDRLLKKYHDQEDYAVVVPKELLRQAERTRSMFNAMLVVIAGISLLVGGIGIMNIMLATVTERTREIGIRRALGAKRGHIIQQFLVETLVLTGSGGILGVCCGMMCGPIFRGVRMLVVSIAPDSIPPIVMSLEPRIALWSVLMSVGISLGVGLLFGLYPARRAAAMNPIEALRHE